jgi:hypothetical protein
MPEPFLSLETEMRLQQLVEATYRLVLREIMDKAEDEQEIRYAMLKLNNQIYTSMEISLRSSFAKKDFEALMAVRPHENPR